MLRGLRVQLMIPLLAATAVTMLARPAIADETTTRSLQSSVANLKLETPRDGSFVVAGLARRAELQQSQSNNPRHEGIGIGVKGGFLFNDFSSAKQDFDSNIGTMVGFFFGGNRPGVVGVMGELMYAKKGSEGVDLHYLEIPILLRVNAGSNSLSGVNVYGIGGPVFDIKLSEPDILNVDDVYEGFDIGVVVGAGVEITRFIVEGRYNWGLRNIVKGDLGTSQEIKTRSFAVLFGFRFN